MAGVTLAPGKFDQLLLVGWMRWRLFVNGLRTAAGQSNLVFLIIAGTGIGLGVAAMGALLGVMSWTAIRYGNPGPLWGGLWLDFVVWLLFPLFLTGFGAESDPGSLLRFPLRYSTFVLLAFAHGVFDPVAAACLYWLAAMLVGIAVASLSALAWAIPAIAALALLNLVLNRAIYAWLSRWMAQRRTREILGALVLLLMLSMQFVGPLNRRYGHRALPWVWLFAPAGHVLPPGMAAASITAGHAGHPGMACTDVAGLLVYSGVLGWLLALRLKAEYRGESLSDAPRLSVEARAPVRAGWKVTGVSPTVSALFEKELRYLLRNARMYLNLLAPLLIVVVFAMGHRSGHAKAGWVYFPMGVAYVVLMFVGPAAYNSLAYEGSGLAMLFAAPIRFRDVMVAKNLLQALVLAAEVVLLFVVVRFVGGPTPPVVVALTLAGAVWATLMNLTVGNLVSLYSPRRLELGQMRRQRASWFATVASLGVLVFVAGLASGLYFLARWRGNMAWCGFGFLGLAGITWVVYRRVLNLTSEIAWKRREALLAELSRSD